MSVGTHDFQTISTARYYDFEDGHVNIFILKIGRTTIFGKLSDVKVCEANFREIRKLSVSLSEAIRKFQH